MSSPLFKPNQVSYKFPDKNIEPTNFHPKAWTKKTLQIESDFKYLRDTGSTMGSTPKNQK